MTHIKPLAFNKALSERYLAYALSTIMSRSLPDVRDGLKPVQRRLLYAMRVLKLDPGAGYKKSARVVGDVIGKYHPHGEMAIYDALVRLAQNFVERYPLIDGQGNFGNVDGDNPAAMRYTEARLTEVTRFMLEGLDADTVDFRPTYDGEDEEPVVLPAKFPNLLANGAQGIAVGMATSIPPHNVGEICEALLHLAQNPEATVARLLKFMPGPDFPTGGLLCEEPETICQAYETGRGSLRLRARWSVEKLARGTWQLVVTEIPYQVQKSRLVEKLAKTLAEKKLSLLGDFHDESTEDVRLVFEPKSRNVDPERLMEQLFRNSDLETRISLNLNVLKPDNRPEVLDLKRLLRAFLDHRHVVLERASRFRLGKIEARLHLLEGFLAAYLNIDLLIKILREEEEPKPEICRAFSLTEVQAEAILNMRLRQLRKLEEEGIRTEHARLSKEKAELEALLASPQKRWEKIEAEIREIKKEFGEGRNKSGLRRTRISGAPKTLDLSENLPLEREAITLIISRQGWVRGIKGHGVKVNELRFKEGDEPAFALEGDSWDKALLLTASGRLFTLGLDALPSGRGLGEPLSIALDLSEAGALQAVVLARSGAKLLLATTKGRGFLAKCDELLAQTRGGKQVLNPAAGDEARHLKLMEGDHIAVVGSNRKLLIFSAEELPEMQRGKGVILQRYKEGTLEDLRGVTLAEGLSWRTSDGRERRETDLSSWLHKRAGAGRVVPHGFPRNNRFES